MEEVIYKYETNGEFTGIYVQILRCLYTIIN